MWRRCLMVDYKELGDASKVCDAFSIIFGDGITVYTKRIMKASANAGTIYMNKKHIGHPVTCIVWPMDRFNSMLREHSSLKTNALSVVRNAMALGLPIPEEWKVAARAYAQEHVLEIDDDFKVIRRDEDESA
jgi:hypothetical protein